MDGQSQATKIPLLVIAGPTAVGKSALSLQLARLFKTDIISCDSALVYRGLNIGTAKPTPEEQKEVAHHLLDLVNPDEGFSVACFQQEAYLAIAQLWGKNKLPLLVGGSGLYIQAVTDGYAFFDQGACFKLRKELEQKAATEEGLSELYSELKIADSKAAAKINQHDKRRMIRALEVYRLKGRPISEQETKTQAAKPPFQAIIYILNRPRAELYERINNRTDKMLNLGFLEEVRLLQSQGCHSLCPGMQVLGYKQLLSCLNHELSFEEAVEAIKKQTRNLAKRQITWFKRLKNARWLNVSEEAGNYEKIAQNIYAQVKELLPRQANNIG